MKHSSTTSWHRIRRTPPPGAWTAPVGAYAAYLAWLPTRERDRSLRAHAPHAAADA